MLLLSQMKWTRANLCADAAKNQFASNPGRTIFDVKRLIGRKWGDKGLNDDIKHFPFKVVDQSGQPRLKVDVKVGTF